MSINSSGDWFAQWFDSRYYHILYCNRNDQEALAFIRKLLNHLEVSEDVQILDLACGSGRHTRSVTALGYQVTGMDLSEESIAMARQQSPGIQYEVGDMRSFDLGRRFGMVMNLFTSFGYFDDVAENAKALGCVARHLFKDGIFVLDYFNATQVVSNLIPKEYIVREGVEFHIRREVRNRHICKRIEVVDGNHRELHEEKVQLFSREDVEAMMIQAGLQPKECFGDYELNAFNQNSPRMIIVAEKN